VQPDPNNAKVVFMGRPTVERRTDPQPKLKKLAKRGLISAKQMRRIAGKEKDA
jgi:hypothetical protein